MSHRIDDLKAMGMNEITQEEIGVGDFPQCFEEIKERSILLKF